MSAEDYVKLLKDGLITKDNVNDTLPIDNSTYLHKFMENPLLFQDKIYTLLKMGADVNVQNTSGHTPLMFSSMGITCMEPNLFDAVLKETNLELTDLLGNTVLHLLSKHYGRYCKRLLDKCVSDIRVLILSKKNNKGETCLHNAKNEETAKGLLSHYTKKEFSYDSNGSSELYTAVQCARAPVATLLCSEILQVPSDISDIINLAIQHGNRGILLKSLLQYAKNDITTENILTAIKNDNYMILNSLSKYFNNYENISDLIAKPGTKSPILLSTCAATSAFNCFTILEQQLSKHSSPDWTEITDNNRSNIAHYCCMYNQVDILRHVTSTQREVLIKQNTFNVYPLAYAIIENHSKFFQNLEMNKVFLNRPPELLNIYQATDTLDLLHFMLTDCTQSQNALDSLVNAGFPFLPDVMGKTPFHKACITFSKAEVLVLLLTRNPDPLLLNALDQSDFTALDYAILNQNEEQIDVLCEAGAITGIKIEKILHWYRGNEDLEEEEVEEIISRFGGNYPTEDSVNPDWVKEVETASLQSKLGTKGSSSFGPVESPFPPLTPQLYKICNILVCIDNLDLEVSFDDVQNGDETLLRVHMIPTSNISLSDAKYFRNLTNKRLVIVGNIVTLSLVSSLKYYTGVLKNKDCFIYQTGEIDENLKNLDFSLCIKIPELSIPFYIERLHLYDVENADQIWENPDNFLSFGDYMMSIDEEQSSRLEKYKDSGFYFLHDSYYFRDYYNTKKAVMETELSELLSCGYEPQFHILNSFGFLCLYYDTNGELKTFRPANHVCDGTLLLRVKIIDITADNESVNISKFVYQTVYKMFVVKFMLVPTPTGLTLNDLSFKIVYNNSDGVLEFGLESVDSATIPVTSKQFLVDCVWKVTRILLKDYPTLDVIVSIPCTLGGRLHYRSLSAVQHTLPGTTEESFAEFCSNFKHDADGSEPSDQCQHDSEQLFRRAIRTGKSQLSEVDLNRLARAVGAEGRDRLIWLLEVDLVTSEAAFIPFKEASCDQLLHRIAVQKAPYLRQFFRTGKWSDQERGRMCSVIGLSIEQTYAKYENVWRANKVDFLILIISLVICVGLVVILKKTGVDLEEFGVGGVLTLPFILLAIKRLVYSYTHDSEQCQRVQEMELTVE